MEIDMTQFYQVFFEESEELLAEAEKLLLNLDVNNPEPEHLNAIFRAAHSIKGGAATFSMMDMTEITHVLESLLDKIRKSEMDLTIDHVDAFLEAKDVLMLQLDGHRNGTPFQDGVVEEVKIKLKTFTDSADKLSMVAEIDVQPTHAHEMTVQPTHAVEKTVQSLPATDNALQARKIESAADAASGAANTGYLIEIKTLSDKDAANLKSELELLGTVQEKKAGDGYTFTLTGDATVEDIIAVSSFIVDIDPGSVTPQTSGTDQKTSAVQMLELVSPALQGQQLADLTSELERLGKLRQSARADGKLVFVLETDVSPQEVLAVSSFVVEPETLTLRSIDANSQNTAQSSLVENVDYGLFDNQPLVRPAAEKQSMQAPQVNLQLVSNTPAKPEAAVTPRREAEKTATSQENSSIRVGIEKVDQLINLVGELVITQAMIEERISALDPVEHERLLNSVGQLTRNTRDLQEAAMSIRMMPMDYVFSRFPRMVRDLAGKLGKKVEFVTQGASTELDKGLIERIIDPLTHLVRNSVDHGIEMPEVRVKSGKTETGRLTLLAAHRGGNIVIEVSDDGGGLNRERILQKARQNGLEVNDSMSDSEVWQLIFAPGFSTAEQITDVSGRGVGMDVVKKNITAMNGSVEIKSALGFGTTVSISLPLTLAILDGMSVSLGDSVYVIPLNLIVETLQPSASDIKSVTGQGQMVHVRGEYLPVIALHALFNQESRFTDPTQGILVLIEAEGKKAALFVDGLVGQQQVVIKSLETDFRKVVGVSGATIMGDGSVALILDIPAIIQIGQSQAQYKEYAA